MTVGALGIGLSALQSYQVAFNVTANNIANGNTNGYVPMRADFHATSPGGVYATISSDGDSATVVDGSSGSNAPSGTDLTQEAVNLLDYKNGYLANAKVVKTQSDLLGTLLDTTG